MLCLDNSVFVAYYAGLLMSNPSVVGMYLCELCESKQECAPVTSMFRCFCKGDVGACIFPLKPWILNGMFPRSRSYTNQATSMGAHSNKIFGKLTVVDHIGKVFLSSLASLESSTQMDFS